jgi:hypothetical protein
VVDPIVDGFTGFPDYSTAMKLRLVFKGIPVPSQAIIFQRQTSLRFIYSIIVDQYIEFPPLIFMFILETFVPLIEDMLTGLFSAFLGIVS